VSNRIISLPPPKENKIKIFSKSRTRPPKKKKTRSVPGQAAFGLLIFPSKSRTKTGQFPGRLYLAFGFFPGRRHLALAKCRPSRGDAASSLVDCGRSRCWHSVLSPSGNHSCKAHFRRLPILPPRGLIAIFLLVNPPVMVASSVAHCSYKKRRQNSGYVTNNKFATRTLSFAKIL
jgi:hypothetical protein